MHKMTTLLTYKGFTLTDIIEYDAEDGYFTCEILDIDGTKWYPAESWTKEGLEESFYDMVDTYLEYGDEIFK